VGTSSFESSFERERVERRARVTAEADARGLGGVLIGPGATLEYLTGYRGSITTERITCLLLRPEASPIMLLPRLEQPVVVDALDRAAPSAGHGLELVTWDDGEDSLDRLAALLPSAAHRIAIDGQLWFERAHGLARRRPDVEQVPAADLVSAVRAVKSELEIEALRAAGAAIDAVHAHVPDWLRAGRTEREVGADIAAAILDAGHATVEFVIVASGPNSASPHSEVSDRVIAEGEPVVVDIGGRMPSGYNSDCTRCYVVGRPHPDLVRLYTTLERAQLAQCDLVAAGVPAAEVDRIGREVIAADGYGEYFMHRTGHGIGLETHEEPYVVAGSDVSLQAGATFSIEPGIYLPGVGGARIEDIVVCRPDGAERLNRRPRHLAQLG
jgi:Xaa-Pro aminopeptidase